jgi:hypothetical protein
MNKSWRLRLMSQEAATDLVMMYTAFELGVRQLAPTSISSTYFPGIIAMLSVNRVPGVALFTAATKDPLVKMVHRGFNRLHRLIHPKSKSLKLAFTASAARSTLRFLSDGLIKVGSARLTDDLRDLANFQIFVILLFGICFLLRKSEFLFKQGKPAPPLRSSCSFFDSNRKLIPHDSVGVTRAQFLSFIVDQSKTDQDGNGRINMIERQPGDCDIVCYLEQYMLRSFRLGAKSSDFLFDCPCLPRVSSNFLSSVMKAAVTLLGLPADRVSTHSLRYGGATMLAAGGFPEYIIAMYGGWKEGSESLRRYTRPSIELIRSVSKHMQAMSLCNIEDDMITMCISRATKGSCV